jgi:hypothetical protein
MTVRHSWIKVTALVNRYCRCAASPLPRQHDEHRGQDEGMRQKQGRAGQEVRALYVPYGEDTHGLSG